MARRDLSPNAWPNDRWGGWPAPFLADDPSTSVTSQLGLEDQFRPGPFIADLAFWFVLFSLASNICSFAVAARYRRKNL